MTPVTPTIKILKSDFIEGSNLVEASFAIRKKVFVEEQNVPESEELDEFENQSRHFLAYYSDTPCGTARWRQTGKDKIKLERFAVLKEFRGLGLGGELVKAVLEDLPTGSEVYLHAQVQVIPFYEKLGFTAFGPEFDECGILHRLMKYSKS